MPTLLLELGCEELPASACREAEAQLPALVLQQLGVEASHVYVTPAPDRVRRRRAARDGVRAAREGAAGGAARAGGGGIRERGTGSPSRTSRSGTAISGPACPESRCAESRCSRGCARSSTGSSSASRCAGTTSGHRFARPVRWFCEKLDEETLAGSGTSFGHRFTHGEVEIGSAQAYADTLRAANVEPDAAERRRRHRGGARRARRLAGPAREARRGRVHGRVAARLRIGVRRAVPPPARARDRHRHAEPPALLPARREPLRRRGRRRRRGRHPARLHAGARRAARGRGLHVRPRRRSRYRRAREPARSDHVLRGRRDARRQGGEARRARRAARRRTSTRARPPGSRRRTRPRSSCASFPSSRESSAPSTRAWPATRTTSASRSPSTTCPTRPTRRFPRRRGGPRALGRGQDRHAHGVVLARPPADRLARPVRPAAGGHRPLPARRRGRRLRPARAPRARRARVRRGAAGGLLDVPVEFVRAARRSAAPDIAGVAERARLLASLEPALLARVHEVYVRSARLAKGGGRRVVGGSPRGRRRASACRRTRGSTRAVSQGRISMPPSRRRTSWRLSSTASSRTYWSCTRTTS